MGEPSQKPGPSAPRTVLLTSGLENLPARLLLQACLVRGFRPTAVVVDPIIRRWSPPEPSIGVKYLRLIRHGMTPYALRKFAGGLRRRLDLSGAGRLPLLDSLAERLGIPLIRSRNVNKPEGLAVLRATAPELLVMLGCRILNAEVLAVPRLALNFHTGLLPDYRGADTLYWAMARGEHHRCGYSIHEGVEAVDAGQVFFEEVVPPRRGELIEDLFRRCCEQATPRWFELFEAFGREGRLSGRPLDLDHGVRYWSVDWWAIAHLESAWLRGYAPAWVPENIPPAQRGGAVA